MVCILSSMGSRHQERLTFIGRTTFRRQGRLFGIREHDRRSHMYLVGKTGTGKSTLLLTLLRQDMVNLHGAAVLDPHGDLVEAALLAVPPERQKALIYLNAPGREIPHGYNPLAGVPTDLRPLAASGLLEVMKKLWRDSWGPRLEHLLRQSFLALLDQPEPTLADVLRLFDDPGFRRRAGERVMNPLVRKFWLREFDGYSPGMRNEMTAPVRNKVGAFLADPHLYAVLTNRKSLDLRKIMDDGRILLVNLAKGRLGEGPSSLLGALLLAGINVAGLSRTDLPEEERRDFYVSVDEFHNFATLSMLTMLSELRKYRVSLTLAHQYLDQLDSRVLAAILGNVGTFVVFRVGASDARALGQEFSPEFAAADLSDLPNHEIAIRLMVDGKPARPFSARTIRLPKS